MNTDTENGVLAPKDALDLMRVSMECHEIAMRDDGLMRDCDGKHYWCKLTRREDNGDIHSDFVVLFSQGKAHTDAPSRERVVWALLMENTEHYTAFEEWAESLGYDTDSRQAERIYNACVSNTDNLLWMFDCDDLEVLNAAFEDY